MGISSSLGSSALLPAGLGFRNVVINGGFDVWQRGTSFSTNNAATAIYTADRWCARALYPNSSAVQTITQESTNIPAGSKFSLKSVVATAAVVNNSRMQLCYTVEPADAIRYAGKQMMLSMQIKAIQNINQVAVIPTYSTTGGKSFDGTAISTNYFTVTTSGFTTCTVSFTLPSAATLTTSGTIGFYLIYTRSSGAAEQVGDGIYLSQVQLEQNYQPTPFEQRPYGVELALCQRYYQRRSGTGSTAYTSLGGFGSFGSTTAADFDFVLPVVMRVVPHTLDYHSVSGFIGSTSSASYTSTGLNIQTATATSSVFAITLSGMSGTAGLSVRLLVNNSTSGYLGWSAEL
jgi:hypothetical protein